MKKILVRMLVPVLFIAVLLFWQYNRNSNLLENGKLIFVKVDDVTLDQYGYPDIHVTYSHQDVIYKRSKSFANLSYRKSRRYLIGKKVGLFYSTVNPEQMEILITPRSFKVTELIMPDSSKKLFEKIQSSW